LESKENILLAAIEFTIVAVKLDEMDFEKMS